MSAKSTARRYGTVAIAFHWLGAALIVVMIFVGVTLDDAESPEPRLTLLRTHAFIGLTVLALTIPRLLWRLVDRKPDPPAGMSRVEWLAARTAHVLLYVLLLGILVSGPTTVVLGGAVDALLGAPGASLPKDFADVAAREVHGALVWTFTGLLLVHIAAALYHHWLRRDDALRRMWRPTGL